MFLYYLRQFLTLNYVNPKIRIFKNLDEILKTWKKFRKTSGNPVKSKHLEKYLGDKF